MGRADAINRAVSILSACVRNNPWAPFFRRLSVIPGNLYNTYFNIGKSRSVSAREAPCKEGTLLEPIPPSPPVSSLLHTTIEPLIHFSFGLASSPSPVDHPSTNCLQ